MKNLLKELEEKEYEKDLNKKIYDELMWLVGGPDEIRPDVEALIKDFLEVDCPESFENLYPRKIKVFVGYRSAIIELDDNTRYHANLLSYDCPRLITFDSSGKSNRNGNITEIGYNEDKKLSWKNIK